MTCLWNYISLYQNIKKRNNSGKSNFGIYECIHHTLILLCKYCNGGLPVSYLFWSLKWDNLTFERNEKFNLYKIMLWNITESVCLRSESSLLVMMVTLTFTINCYLWPQWLLFSITYSLTLSGPKDHLFNWRGKKTQQSDSGS